MLPLSNYNASTHTNYLTELLKSVPVFSRGQEPVRPMRTLPSSFERLGWLPPEDPEQTRKYTGRRTLLTSPNGLLLRVFLGLAEGHRSLSERRII